MKKNLILFSSILFFFTTLFTGCYDPVFYEVMKDVKPEEATVSGFINSITRFTVDEKEYLVLAADGGIRYKLKDDENHGSWKTDSEFPFEMHSYDAMNAVHNGHQILKVLADSSNLYLVTATYENYDSKGTTGVSSIYIWANNSIKTGTDGISWVNSKNNWKCVIADIDKTMFPFYFSSDYQYSAFAVFQTNTPKQANRKVFIRSGNANASDSDYKTVKYYELSDKGAKSISVAKVEDSETNNATSAVFFNGEYLFFNSLAATTNETYTKDADRIYFGIGNYLYYNATAGSKEKYLQKLNVGNAISTIAVCSDSILIGRAAFATSDSSTSYGGIVKTTNTDGVPGNDLADFDTNAEFQLSSSYLINTIINATPDKSENNSALYASISFYGTGTSTNVNYNNIGLWSYYPSRGNWNRE